MMSPRLPSEMFDPFSLQAFIDDMLMGDDMTPQFFISRDRVVPIFNDEENQYSWAKILRQRH